MKLNTRNKDDEKILRHINYFILVESIGSLKLSTTVNNSQKYSEVLKIPGM